MAKSLWRRFPSDDFDENDFNRADDSEFCNIISDETGINSDFIFNEFWELTGIAPVIIIPESIYSVVSRINPLTRLSGILITPNNLYSITSINNPEVVKASLNLNDIADVITAGNNPSYTAGSLTFTKIAQTAADKLNPDVRLSSLNISVYAVVKADVNMPLCYYGSLNISDSINAVSHKSDPVVIKGSLIITPDTTYVIANHNNPQINISVLSDIVINPTEVVILTGNVNPNVLIQLAQPSFIKIINQSSVITRELFKEINIQNIVYNSLIENDFFTNTVFNYELNYVSNINIECNIQEEY